MEEKQAGEDEIIEIEPRKFAPDWYRTGRFGVLGFFLVAPVSTSILYLFDSKVTLPLHGLGNF